MGKLGLVTPTLATTWPQALAWRMRRQMLDPPGTATAVDIVRRLCGVQAQVPSAAVLAVAVRQRQPAADVVDAGLRDGSLMRTWAMRGTLHLLAPDEAGAYLSLLVAGRHWERGSWVKTFGVSSAEMVELTEAVSEALDGETLTREELVARVGEKLGHGRLEEQLRSGWGAVLKPVAWQGALCQGPANGNRVTFVRPDQALPGWTGLPDADDGARTVIPAYLRAYGPATAETFDAWLFRGQTRKAMLRGWFAALGDTLATVEVEGTPAYLLAEDVDDLAKTKPTKAVRLLPGFDQYVLGAGTGAAEIVPPAHRKEVSRTAGWISPVVVAGGRVVGTWESADGKVDVRLFEDSPALSKKLLDAEVKRQTALLA